MPQWHGRSANLLILVLFFLKRAKGLPHSLIKRESLEQFLEARRQFTGQEKT